MTKKKMKNKTYLPKVRCSNCGETFNYATDICLEIPRGVRISEENCPNCGCKTLEKDV